MTRRQLLAAAGLWAGWLAGCGDGSPRPVAVHGQVIYRGQPLTSGTVTFVPLGPGPAATGAIQADGRFTLTTFQSGDGALPGNYAIMVVVIADSKGQLPEERGPNTLLLIPHKYTNYLTSELSAQITDGASDVMIELK